MTDLGPHLLGRKVDHDIRSRSFPAPRLVAAKPNLVAWRHYGTVLDQGDLGSCTACAFMQWKNTVPAHVAPIVYRLSEAEALYHEETIVQGGEVFPPADPGGSGLAVCKAAQNLGLIRSYTHAFGIAHAVAAIPLSPFLVGTNWYTSMFDVNAAGNMAEISGAVAGGHEYLCTGFDPKLDRWRFLNSWGKGWGKGGAFYMTTAMFARLLDEQGDITVPAL